MIFLTKCHKRLYRARKLLSPGDVTTAKGDVTLSVGMLEWMSLLGLAVEQEMGWCPVHNADRNNTQLLGCVVVTLSSQYFRLHSTHRRKTGQQWTSHRQSSRRCPGEHTPITREETLAQKHWSGTKSRQRWHSCSLLVYSKKMQCCEHFYSGF